MKEEIKEAAYKAFPGLGTYYIKPSEYSALRPFSLEVEGISYFDSPEITERIYVDNRALHDAFEMGAKYILENLQTHNEKIARAAFEAGRARKETYQQEGRYSYNHHSSHTWSTSESYLQSPEYKELVGVK